MAQRMETLKKRESYSSLIIPLTIYEKKKRLTEAYTKKLRAGKKIDLDEWSDKYRELPKETSSEYGRWRTARFPFLRKVMKALSPSSRAKEIVAMKGAQLGFTELAINWMLYTADHDPGPMMYIQKTKEAAEDFSTQKLVPSIELCTKIQKSIGLRKPKHLSNTTYNKGFPGGYVVLGGSNSGAFLRSKSIAKAVADEEDSFERNVDGEGSPIFMVRKRLSNFPDSKFFRLSTPKIKETSTIEPAYLSGSQEQFYVPCPCCNPEASHGGTYWTIRWENILWDKDKGGAAILDDEGVPANVALVCEDCGEIIQEHHKTFMLENGRWLSVKDNDPEDPTAKPYEVGDVEFPSFHINSLYSPLGFFSWRDAVIEFFDYKKTGDKGLLQGFVNQTLGETYTLAGQDVNYNVLYNRREVYDPDGKGFDIPAGGLVVTAGVDVQADRLEIETGAWGLADELFSLDYHIIYGSTDTLGDAQGLDAYGNRTAWSLLDEWLLKEYVHESGARLRIECTLIDTGYMADVVHIFCRNRAHRRIFPVKGRDGWGRGYIERPKRVHAQYKTWDFTAWVDELKERTYSQLLIDQPGPGFVHHPKKDAYSEKYFAGLTAENKEVVMNQGKKKLVWKCPPGVRNEPLDLRNYMKAAFLVYAPNMEARAQRLSTISGPASVVGMEGHQAPVHRKKKRRRRSSSGIA